MHQPPGCGMLPGETAHASRDGERRPHATEPGKLYRLPTETKNVYVVLSAVQERLCLCLQNTHTHTDTHHTHTHAPCHLETLEQSHCNNSLYFLTWTLEEYLEIINFAVYTKSPPRWRLHVVVVEGLERLNDSTGHAGGSLATGRVFQAGRAAEERPD